jgi:proteasome lid subunit RPN8/RPN11
LTSFEQDFIFPVYIHEITINHIKNLCKNSDKEIFGYLIGLILKWNDNKYIIIKEQIYIENTVRSNVFETSQIEGTAGEYEKEFQKLKHNIKDKNLRVLGWWHSHINLGCFLSITDIHTQEYFFPAPYQVALVVDPIRDEFKFFTLNKNSKNKYKALSYAIISSN